MGYDGDNKKERKKHIQTLDEFDLQTGDEENKPARYTTSFAYKVRTPTSEMIAWKRTNRCIIMDEHLVTLER